MCLWHKDKKGSVPVAHENDIIYEAAKLSDRDLLQILAMAKGMEAANKINAQERGA